MSSQRGIPSIDRLRQRPLVAALEAEFGARAVLDALRAEAAAVREAMIAGASYDDAGRTIQENAAARLRESAQPSLRPVINATGVVIHTNLGRAPLSHRAAAQVAELAAGYSNLEYDLASGTRGRRDLHAERLIRDITGAEAACVVNNNAAAALITLAALAAGREVIVSRGELVEIGGGFRVPDVMAQSGAVLREVGTTNRTRASDYAAAISDRTALILRVHPSNFRIEGFTERPSVPDLAALSLRFGIPLVDDLGSGHLWEEALPLRDEPSVQGTLAAGADLVMFSGDKLLGGPQAGIIAGKQPLLDRIRRHPLMRAVRVDKMTYAALEATLQACAAGRRDEIPVARMIALTADEVSARAQRLADALSGSGLTVSVIDGVSMIGGGSAPGASLPTRLLALTHPAHRADALETYLRSLETPVIARIDNDRVVLDLRTVLPEQDQLLLDMLQRPIPNSQRPREANSQR